MNIKIEATADNKALIKAMASDNKAEAFTAQAAVAKFVMAPIEDLVKQAAILSKWYKDFSFNEDDNPTIPVSFYADRTAEGSLTVWSQSVSGGLASNFTIPYGTELRFQTYSLDSAISFDAKHARKARLDVIGPELTMLAQTFLAKMERLSANQILQMLAANATDALAISSTTTAKLLPADFNSLLLKMARMNTAWNGGTAVGVSNKVTDVFMSPERMFDMRAMAYNPINTTAPNGIAAANSSGAVQAPEGVRAELFNGGGVASFYGMGLHEMQELGVAKRYVTKFKEYADAASVTFNSADDLMLAVNMGNSGLIRPVEVNAETNAQVRLVPDDQYASRQERIGFYGKIEEARLGFNNRGVAGIRVKGA